MLKSFFISLIFHGFFLFVIIDPKDECHMQKVHSEASEKLTVMIRLNEREIQEAQNQIKVVKNKIIRREAPIRKKRDFVDNLEKKKIVNLISKSAAPEIKAVKNSYISELRRFIESKKFYPKLASRLRHHGIVEIALTINEEGEFTDVHIHTASSYETLNQAALKLIKTIKSFKPLPKELDRKMALSIPLNYSL